MALGSLVCHEFSAKEFNVSFKQLFLNFHQAVIALFVGGTHCLYIAVLAKFYRRKRRLEAARKNRKAGTIR